MRSAHGDGMEDKKVEEIEYLGKEPPAARINFKLNSCGTSNELGLMNYNPESVFTFFFSIQLILMSRFSLLLNA